MTIIKWPYVIVIDNKLLISRAIVGIEKPNGYFFSITRPNSFKLQSNEGRDVIQNDINFFIRT
ncbi:hypothetical protein BEN49_15565 [Hymenobacter coccineus]|uniref:Uncharacterized protein n=1 Tax=Hymenobacter coccineus TaxID=1908235 RepID=A0A1G1SRS5_9BACT|nr:hypothetical protein BEN49_15565 [Hymenobacter coccineus]